MNILGDPEVNANIYCKSRNLPNTDTQNYSTDLRQLLGHPVPDSWHGFLFYDYDSFSLFLPKFNLLIYLCLL